MSPAAEGDGMSDEESGFELRTQHLSEKDAECKQNNLYSKYGQVLRSKGFFWIVGRDDVHGEWSTAGAVLRFSPGSPWFAAIPEEMWDGADVSIEHHCRCMWFSLLH